MRKNRVFLKPAPPEVRNRCMQPKPQPELSKESELYTAYWRAMEQGYKPNIKNYLQ